MFGYHSKHLFNEVAVRVQDIDGGWGVDLIDVPVESGGGELA